MTDDELLAAFEAHTLPNSAFHHLDHVRVAWVCLDRDGLERGSSRMIEGLRAFAHAHGVPQLYNETLTRFWVRLVGHVMEAFPDARTFDALLARFPRLADKTLPSRHYRAETLQGEAARRAWVEPDLVPLP